MRDLQKDLEICNRATPGPWEATSESDEDVRVCQTENEECVCCLALMGDYDWEKEEWKEGSKKQWNKDAEFIAAAREGWPHALERAIKAEAKLDRLIEGCMRCAGEDDHERFQRLRAEVERLYEINQGCESEAHLYDDLLRRCRAENAQLRKVVDAARGIFLGEGEHLCSEFEDAMDTLRQALAELDKDGER